MRFTRRHLAATAAAALAIGVVGMAGPASAAATWKVSCTTKSGDVGTLWFNHTGSSITGSTVTQVNYNIKIKAKHGNHSNIEITDTGTAPSTKIDTGAAIGNGHTHKLREKNYHRGSGHIYFTFIFDHSGAADPKCGK